MSEVVVQPYSTTTLESARKAKVSMENFYENLLIQEKDRTNRLGKPVALFEPEAI